MAAKLPANPVSKGMIYSPAYGETAFTAWVDGLAQDDDDWDDDDSSEVWDEDDDDDDQDDIWGVMVRVQRTF